MAEINEITCAWCDCQMIDDWAAQDMAAHLTDGEHKEVKKDCPECLKPNTISMRGIMHVSVITDQGITKADEKYLAWKNEQAAPPIDSAPKP